MTPFTDIYDLFLVLIQDYKIDIIFESTGGVTALNSYLQGFLKFAISSFSGVCDQDIKASADYTLGQFSITLDEKNKIMLATEMQLPWITREINNVLDMKPQLSTADFKRFSEAANLSAMSNRQQVLREEISQAETTYFIRYKNKMSDWDAGGFFV